MTNKEAFDIVLKMAKDRDMTGYDMMYDGQEAEASLGRGSRPPRALYG